jgi:hypothetical protein
MIRSYHPLLLLGICALSASSAVALSNDIQSPHRLFRDGMLRKSALNSDESNELDAVALSNDAVLQYETGTADVRTMDDGGDDGEDASRDGSMEVVVETPDDESLNEWFDYNRQKDDDGLLSMDTTGGVDDIEFLECVEVKVCPDPACSEMEVVAAEDPALNRRKSLLRRHLESKTHKAQKEHQDQAAKSGKAATTASALPMAEIPVFESKIVVVDVATTSKKPKSGKMTPPDSQIPPTNGDAAITILPSTSDFLTKSGKVSKAAKGCKSGKGCKMVLQCTSTKSPAGTEIITAPPVSGKQTQIRFVCHLVLSQSLISTSHRYSRVNRPVRLRLGLHPPSLAAPRLHQRLHPPAWEHRRLCSELSRPSWGRPRPCLGRHPP